MIGQRDHGTRTNGHEARWWESAPDGRAHCFLCPRHCRLGEGQAGFCSLRENRGGRLVSLGYGAVAALQVDPVEKKPLHHFLPGTKILSLGTAGCDLGCSYCQNWDLSRSRLDRLRALWLPPERVVTLARERDCPSIAFTYNEPTIWGEYVVDVCRLARASGLRTVLVTNGYVTREAFHDLYAHVDAANVDLKAFSDEFYRRRTLARLQPVLDVLTWIRRETGVWLEVTNLLIPTLNDDDADVRRLCEWMLAELGPDVPLHFTAFRPDFHLAHLPPTPRATLRRARALARDLGLHHVYEGNVRSEGTHTFCAACGALLIRRSGYEVLELRLRDGRCADCGAHLPGRWTMEDAAMASHPPEAI